VLKAAVFRAWLVMTIAAGATAWEDPTPEVYALTSSDLLNETLDLFLTREAAEAELREILFDEPDWEDVLRVVPIELDGRNVSGN
jgi:hypothetical protein